MDEVCPKVGQASGSSWRRRHWGVGRDGRRCEGREVAPLSRAPLEIWRDCWENIQTFIERSDVIPWGICEYLKKLINSWHVQAICGSFRSCTLAHYNGLINKAIVIWGESVWIFMGSTDCTMWWRHRFAKRASHTRRVTDRSYPSSPVLSPTLVARGECLRSENNTVVTRRKQRMS